MHTFFFSAAAYRSLFPSPEKAIFLHFLHHPIDNWLLTQSSDLGKILQYYNIYGAGKIKSRFICVFLMVFSLPFSAVSLRVETCLLTDKKALFGESSSPQFGMTRRKTIKIAWQKISFDIIKMSELSSSDRIQMFGASAIYLTLVGGFPQAPSTAEHRSGIWNPVISVSFIIVRLKWIFIVSLYCSERFWRQ